MDRVPYGVETTQPDINNNNNNNNDDDDGDGKPDEWVLRFCKQTTNYAMIVCSLDRGYVQSLIYRCATTVSKQYYRLPTYLLIYYKAAVLDCHKICSCNINFRLFLFLLKWNDPCIWFEFSHTIHRVHALFKNLYRYFIVLTRLDLSTGLVLVNGYDSFLLTMLCLYLESSTYLRSCQLKSLCWFFSHQYIKQSLISVCVNWLQFTM